MSAEPTGHKRDMRIVLATLAVLLAMTGVAEAKSFRGQTSQKRIASMVVGKDGLVTRIRISYSAPCSDPRYRFPNVLRIEPPFETSTTDDVTETVTLRDRLERRRAQPADRDRHRPAHGRRRRRRVLERHVQDARRPHQGRQAPRHVRAQARDLDGDAYFLSVTVSVFVVLLPAVSVTTAVNVSFTRLSFLNALRPSTDSLTFSVDVPGVSAALSVPTDRLSLSFFAVALSSVSVSVAVAFSFVVSAIATACFLLAFLSAIVGAVVSFGGAAAAA